MMGNCIDDEQYQRCSTALTEARLLPAFLQAIPLLLLPHQRGTPCLLLAGPAPPQQQVPAAVQQAVPAAPSGRGGGRWGQHWQLVPRAREEPSLEERFSNAMFSHGNGGGWGGVGVGAVASPLRSRLIIINNRHGQHFH